MEKYFFSLFEINLKFKKGPNFIHGQTDTGDIVTSLANKKQAGAELCQAQHTLS